VFTKLATLSTIEASGAVLIIRLPDADTAERVAHAAIEGGFRAMKVTLSIPGAVDLIHRLADRILVVAGLPTDEQPDGSAAAMPRSDGDDPTSSPASPIR
jgi:2-keto-3-deoxy-6-phosphogluconate aldolase